ncbi:MAG: aldehyde dehydrogenase family protein [Clostridiales Family XIII bacterium]|jgi:acyl-CoA reductase-like NAD-dependent aldehyde dehydrogenase|nr:aldehyde dehydrogenase family protein [Clostridiales Family XIII bacterium]
MDNLSIIDTDLLSIQESRILAENAEVARNRLLEFPQEKLDEIVSAMFNSIKPYINELAKNSFIETDLGILEDKIIKFKFIIKYLEKALKDMRCVGIIAKDENTLTMAIGVPVGPIAAFCPVTSPITTTVYNAIIAVKAGNSIIFAPHPRAKNCIIKALNILIESAEQKGLPKNAISYLRNISKGGAISLMHHDKIAMIMNTGVPGLSEEAYKSGKPIIIGGHGNGPAFIERTANIKKAVRDIFTSKTFDNGIVSAAEQSVVVDSPIEKEVRKEFVLQGAYFMSENESNMLAKLFFEKNGRPNIQTVGINAKRLAKKAGFIVPDNTRVLISLQKYANSENPYSKEKLCPVLSYFIEDDWKNACEKCIELLIRGKNGHTLVIHSNDPEVIRQFALKKPVGRILVNTPAVFGGMGATTGLFPAMTLGSASAGQGITSENVSPMNLVYIRKFGYEIKDIEKVIDELKGDKNGY